MSRRRRAMQMVLVTAVMIGAPLVPVLASPAFAATLPPDFQEQTVFTGLVEPTNIEFAPDGRIFVAEKRGTIKVFDNLADPTATIFADLSTNVHNMWDRGLLGLALAPNFPTDPWVYVLYTYDAPPGQTAPVWSDVCPSDPNDGTCIVTGRLSRLQANGNVMTGSEQVLITDWCQQYPSHSVGDLHFGADGALYVTGGDGASFSATDFGQLSNPINPCGDPPGGAMTPPSAEGGALRSQDLRTLGDPTTLDGAVLRLDPVTGLAMPGNPLIGSADVNARRIVAHGLRNPFRFTFRPGTNELWINDVGWNTWEEVNRITNPTAGVTNFGWPCFEGAGRMASYDSANLTICENLYAGGGQNGPYMAYRHNSTVVAGETCPADQGSSVTGSVFYPASGGPYPAAFQGALFFADYSRNCIWAMKPQTPGGPPSPTNIETFVAGAAGPTDLAIGPGGELYYTDLNTGTVRRIRYFPANQPPVAQISASPTSGAAPLTVNFNGTGSTDADPADQGRLQFRWDFTSDGTVDATTPTATFTYQTAGLYTASLTVVDTLGEAGTTTVAITPGSSGPTAFMDTPSAGLTWAVGDTINFSGHATDPEQGTLPASALTWRLRMQHCSSANSCHSHIVQDFVGVASGSFVAPDHEYPSYLELQLTATDATGLTSTVIRRLDPKTVTLTFVADPAGVRITVGSTTLSAPFTVTVIQGSTVSVSATTPQKYRGKWYYFTTWSHRSPQTHIITAPTGSATFSATFTRGLRP